MWENTNTKDPPKVVFEKIKISEKLYEQFKEMIEKEKTIHV